MPKIPNFFKNLIIANHPDSPSGEAPFAIEVYGPYSVGATKIELVDTLYFGAYPTQDKYLEAMRRLHWYQEGSSWTIVGPLKVYTFNIRKMTKSEEVLYL